MSEVRWFVTTERYGEAFRAGLGEAELERTLDHLARRGDRRCTVDTTVNREHNRAEVNLRLRRRRS